MKDQILEALNWRFATQEYDTEKPLEQDKLDTILEAGRLAPSSDGLEPWKFIVVENNDIRKKISEAGFNQPKITEAPVLVAITYRTDADALPAENVDRANLGDKRQARLEYLQNGIQKKKTHGYGYEAWAKSQTYIPLGMMLLTAALLKVDGGPMEGFDPEKVGDILGLPSKNLKIATLMALGYRNEGPTRPKVRQALADVVEYVK